ncbi:MAG: hypothetical protein AB2A00_09990 [Myxococcota bacterium]
MSTVKAPGGGAPQTAADQLRMARANVRQEVLRQARVGKPTGAPTTGEGTAPASAEQKSDPKAPARAKSSSSSSPTSTTSRTSSRSQGTSAPNVKTQQAKAKQEATEASAVKVHEAAEVESGASDAFTGDTSNLHDMKRMIGADEGGAAPTVPHDVFDPSLSPTEVEQLGNIRAAVHMVRLMDHWARAGVTKEQVLSDASQMLLGFSRPEAARSVLKELERAPIKTVYPLELQLSLLDQVPGFFPNVSRGHVVDNKERLEKGDRVLAGHDCRVHVPSRAKVKSFALLTPGEPGYEFEPLKPGVFRLLVDTPGEWTFALRAELAGQATIDTFTVKVRDPNAGVPAHLVEPSLDGEPEGGWTKLSD